MEYYSTIKRHELASCGKMRRKLKTRIAKWQKPAWRGSGRHDPNYTPLRKRQEDRDNKKAGPGGLSGTDAIRTTPPCWVHVTARLSEARDTGTEGPRR